MSSRNIVAIGKSFGVSLGVAPKVYLVTILALLRMVMTLESFLVMPNLSERVDEMKSTRKQLGSSIVHEIDKESSDL